MAPHCLGGIHKNFAIDLAGRRENLAGSGSANGL